MPDTSENDYSFGGSNKDNWMDSAGAGANHGGDVDLKMRTDWGKDEAPFYLRPVMYADISALAAGRVIRKAVLRIYVSAFTWADIGDSGVNALNIYSVLPADDDWVEDEATWTLKKTGSNWNGPGGGSPSKPRADFQDGPTATGWFGILVSTIAAFAHLENSGIFDFVGLIQAGVDNREMVFNSDENGSNKPILRVTHEAKGRQVFM